jgi:hypothetical protein
MKHHIIIRLIVFCALFLGVGQFGMQHTARATSNQVHVGVGIGVHSVYHRHHRRRRHHHRVVVAPRLDIHTR